MTLRNSTLHLPCDCSATLARYGTAASENASALWRHAQCHGAQAQLPAMPYHTRDPLHTFKAPYRH